MLATVAAADNASTVRKMYSVFIHSEAEPHAMYPICKQTLTLCVLQYIYIYVCVCVILSCAITSKTKMIVVTGAKVLREIDLTMFFYKCLPCYWSD